LSIRQSLGDKIVLQMAPIKNNKESGMATYECSKCGMGVNATCAKCDAPLVDDTLKLDDGNEVQISKCPNGHGKIKSPMCCGQDMTCTVK
jgi:hypothetical protein